MTPGTGARKGFDPAAPGQARRAGQGCAAAPVPFSLSLRADTKPHDVPRAGLAASFLWGQHLEAEGGEAELQNKANCSGAKQS